MDMGKKKCAVHRYDTRLLPQALLYGAVAFLGFAGDYGMLWLLTEGLGLYYLYAVPIAFVFGLAVNYLGGRLWVYSKGGRNRGLEISAFLLISLLALLLTEGLMYVLTDLLGAHYLVSRLVCGVVTFLFNFFMRRWVLYGKTAE